MTRTIIRQDAGETLMVLLPIDPVSASSDAHWWRIGDGRILETGTDSEWLNRGLPIIGLAPISRARLVFTKVDGDHNERQRLTVARMTALQEALCEPGTLHAAAVPFSTVSDQFLVAIAANDMMLGWIDWAERHFINIGPIVPAAMVLPLGEQWTRVVVGNDAIVGHFGLAMPDEPGLTDILVDGPVELLSEELLGDAIVSIAADPVPNLRSGPFARKRVLVDRSQWRLIASLAISIVLVTTLIAIVEILKLNGTTARLDSETLAIARNIAGPGVTIETAESAVAQRTGGARGVSAPLASLLAKLQREQDVAVVSLGYGPGQVSTTLAAPTVDPANRVLAALQREGYRVTAVPRQSSDGRAMVDVTIRDGL